MIARSVLIRIGQAALLFAALACPYFDVTGYSATTTSQVNASVTVNPVFNLTLNTASIDFGRAKPGEWIEVSAAVGYANAAICKSNTGTTWYLNIKADGPLTSGSYSMPVGCFKWMSTYAGSKNSPYNNLSAGLTHPPASGYVDFSLTDSSVYTSTSGDMNNLPEGTEVQFKYAIQVPTSPSPPIGNYSTTVTYTMTE